MNNHPTTAKPSAHPRRFRSTLAAAILPALILLLGHQTSEAGSAIWKASPGTKNWNTATNWSPATIPNGPSDTATFATSSKRNLSLSANTEVNGITFNSGASAFTISVPPGGFFDISGAGITNNSSVTQKFVATGDATSGFATIQFNNSSTAGNSTNFTLNGNAYIEFHATSTASNGAFSLNYDPASGYYGSITFSDSSTAANGSFALNGGSQTYFSGTSTAGTGTFALNGNTVTGNPSYIQFFDSSKASNGIFTLNPPAQIYFSNSTTADTGTFTLKGNVAGLQSSMSFNDSSTAGNGIFTVEGSTVTSGNGGSVSINSGASAGDGIFTLNGGAVSGGSGGFMFVFGNAAAATLTANAATVSDAYGATIFFYYDSLGGTSRVKVFGNGTGDFTNGSLDISQVYTGVTIGSLEGNGNVALGDGKNLRVGANNLSTVFSGVMLSYAGGASSLTKTGKGKLTLTNANIYSGGTTVSKGTLIVKNKTGSATGGGPVQLNSGTLSGTGKIAGAVTVGNGTTSGANLLAGTGATLPGTLTVNNSITFQSLSTYKCVLKRSPTVKASKLSALGVTISSGATFTFLDTTTGTLTPGTVFTVINNTSANPISGTFSNLADGLIFNSNGTDFKVSYTGGTCNDLTLTVQ